MTKRWLIVGNWKMHGNTAEIAALLQRLRAQTTLQTEAELVVCPPTPYLPQVQHLLTDSAIAWGGQDVSAATEGAYTGQVSAAMLREFDCRYVIVGHSERRHGCAESATLVAEKARAAHQAGLIPIVCVGETLDQRQSDNTLTVLENQLAPVIAWLQQDAIPAATVAVAYEPVWAIGTGQAATPAQAQSVHAFLRKTLAPCADTTAIRLLYGGSVKADNAPALFAEPDIDGALVGGASLDSEAFAAIYHAAARLSHPDTSPL